MCAASKGKNDVIEYLHSQNDQLINRKNDDGWTALQIAEKSQPVDTYSLFNRDYLPLPYYTETVKLLKKLLSESESK